KKQKRQLYLDYQDPFLKSLSAKPIKRQVTAPILIPPKPIINPPNVVYHGFITKKDNSRKLALLTHNGKRVILAEGDYFGDNLLKLVATDSIQVVNNRGTFAFTKNR
ncbi:MAG: hypothetical protein KI790_19625, partial [Cyclobacteriaceae bacterium]|nr:hypothetical protein [Cyclobacteriaceae bacterium HetDA_MAG_MS6]